MQGQEALAMQEKEKEEQGKEMVVELFVKQVTEMQGFAS